MYIGWPVPGGRVLDALASTTDLKGELIIKNTAEGTRS